MVKNVNTADEMREIVGRDDSPQMHRVAGKKEKAALYKKVTVSASSGSGMRSQWCCLLTSKT